MFAKQTVRDIDLRDKTVLLRADYNVPVDNGKITDDYRIQQSLPTLEYLLERDVKLIICSHLGRPKGPKDISSSLFPVAKRLQQLLDKHVAFATDCVGPAAVKATKALKNGQVLLLENLRFHPEEKANDDKFAKQLAGLADVYVDDAFGAAHRDDASIVAITRHLPSVAGLLLEKEVETIAKVMEEPEKPLMAIIGGAKIADKIDMLERLINKADFIAVGGAMANTFLAAESFDVADSLYDKHNLTLAKEIIRQAEAEASKRPFTFFIPSDVVVATSADKATPTRIVELSSHVIADVEHYPKRPSVSASKLHISEKILDIGPQSAAFIAGTVQLAKTVVWNGTMGVTEIKGLQGPIGPFSHGTQTVVEALLGDYGSRPYTFVGGGDTVGYVESRKLVDAFDHVSTGGGASLELMSGHKLPGVQALPDK